MTIIEAIALIITALVVPYGVQLVKHDAITGNAARWLAIGISVACGIVCGLVGGIPATPGAWVTCVFASVGGVQFAYALFRSVGVTSKLLDALAEVKVTGNAE